MSENIFSLSHVALYVKGWYNRSNNIIEDLSKCIEADGFPFNNTTHDIFNLIFGKLINSKIIHPETNLKSLINSASPHDCWRVGYYTKDSLCNPNPQIEYNYYTALIYSCLYYVQNLEKDQWNYHVKPDPNVLPVSKEKVKEYEKLIIQS